MIGWIISWYILFSLFDNKQPRFVAFVGPAVVMLAVNLIAALTRRSKAARAIGYCVCLTLLIYQAVSVARADRRGYLGIDRIVAQTFNSGTPGNIAYIGTDRQMFVPWVRILDPTRKVYVLQGDDIAAVSPDFATACRDFQVKWVFLQNSSDSSQALAKIRQELAGSSFELVRHDSFGPLGAERGLEVYRYRGPISIRMHTVPLRS